MRESPRPLQSGAGGSSCVTQPMPTRPLRGIPTCSRHCPCRGCEPWRWRKRAESGSGCFSGWMAVLQALGKQLLQYHFQCAASVGAKRKNKQNKLNANAWLLPSQFPYVRAFKTFIMNQYMLVMYAVIVNILACVLFPTRKNVKMNILKLAIYIYISHSNRSIQYLAYYAKSQHL